MMDSQRKGRFAPGESYLRWQHEAEVEAARARKQGAQSEQMSQQEVRMTEAVTEAISL